MPFIDKMLERLSKHTHFCFLDGYSGFSQIPVSQSDQEKTTLYGNPVLEVKLLDNDEWYGNPILEVKLLDNDEPTSYGEAMMGLDFEKWLEALKSEMVSMYENKVWALEVLLEGRKTIQNKWIFKRRTDADGNVTVYKARLVAKGFHKFKELTMMRLSYP